MATEFSHGERAMAEVAAGAARFTAGKGRHGTFD
jgi:enoyl-CoA hydratase